MHDYGRKLIVGVGRWRDPSRLPERVVQSFGPKRFFAINPPASFNKPTRSPETQRISDQSALISQFSEIAQEKRIIWKVPHMFCQ
jgi:hypothetical protein